MARRNPLTGPLTKIVGTALEAVKDPKGTAGKAVDQVRGTAALGRMVAESVAGKAVEQVADRVRARKGSDAPHAESPQGHLRPVPAPAAEKVPAKKAPAKKAPQAEPEPQPIVRPTKADREAAKEASPADVAEKAAKKSPARKPAAKKAPARKSAAPTAPAAKSGDTPGDVLPPGQEGSSPVS